MPDQWIVISRWDDFQHPDATRSGIPPWIKTYTRLLSSDDFLALSHHQRGVLLGLWLEYARARRQLRDSTVALTRRLGQRVTRRDLDSLNHAGFIEFSASKPASTTASIPASPDKRREETPKSPSGTASKGPFICGIDGCTVTYSTEKRIAEHRENVHDVTPTSNGAVDEELEFVLIDASQPGYYEDVDPPPADEPA
jgi:hypothetical protein